MRGVGGYEGRGREPEGDRRTRDGQTDRERERETSALQKKRGPGRGGKGGCARGGLGKTVQNKGGRRARVRAGVPLAGSPAPVGTRPRAEWVPPTRNPVLRRHEVGGPAAAPAAPGGGAGRRGCSSPWGCPWGGVRGAREEEERSRRRRRRKASGCCPYTHYTEQTR